VDLGAALVIEDARDHPLVRDNLAIRDLGVIAYAGIPLVTSDGAALGSFCVIDHAPRRWTDGEVAALRDLAASAVTEIELRAALRARDDFLARVSHELRTPLFGIASNAQMLGMGICGPVTERQAEALRRIDRSQRHLLALVERLLDLKRAAAGRMDYVLAPVPVDEVLGEAAALTETHLAEAGLRLVHHPSPGLAARGDGDGVRQVLVNLLSNAAKFTPRGGTVTLASDADDGWVRVRVRDTGVGIPADQREAVFEPFVQLRGVGPRGGGAGLGLAISRDLARGMGGDLTLESEVGAGSTFTLTLPRAADG
jgi:signal transduction histidine kinase